MTELSVLLGLVVLKLPHPGHDERPGLMPPWPPDRSPARAVVSRQTGDRRESAAHRSPARKTVLSKLKMFGLAFAPAAGAFVLAMLKDPPKSVASNPTQTVRPLDLEIQTDDHDAN
jgi:hypothetical protein